MRADRDEQQAREDTGVDIAAIEACIVALPLRHAMRMAGESLSATHSLLVKVTSREGLVGWGESACAPLMTGETPESMLAAVRYLTPFLVALQAQDQVCVERELSWRMYGNQAAKSALRMALLDLTARTRALPLHALLGPLLRERVPVLWLIGTGSAEGDVAEAVARKRQGYAAFKIKIGTSSVKEDADRTQALCQALSGGEVLIGADANQGFDERAAIEYVRAVEHTRLGFVEQPVAGDDLGAMARVAAASGIAVGADEGIHSERDIRDHHLAHAAEGCSLKCIKLGGPQAVLRAARLCADLGMRVNLASKIAESSVASAALLHLAAVVPAVEWGVSPAMQYLAQDVVAAPLRIEQGHARVPQGHGLGVEVDGDLVRALRVMV